MCDTATRSDALETLAAAVRSGSFDEAAARQLYTLGSDAVTLALLAAARRIAEQDARLAPQDAQFAQAVLMSIYRTLRLRGHDPLHTIAHALRTYLQNSQLPPLPTPAIAGG